MDPAWRKLVCWTQDDWTAHVSTHIPDPTTQSEFTGKRGKGQLANGTNVCARFVCNVHGQPISANRAAAIRSRLYSLWTGIAEAGSFPTGAWKKADPKITDPIHRDLSANFPELSWCESNWKVYQIVRDNYSWWTGKFIRRKSAAKQEQQDRKVKLEVLTTSAPLWNPKSVLEKRKEAPVQSSPEPKRLKSVQHILPDVDEATSVSTSPY